DWRYIASPDVKTHNKQVIYHVVRLTDNVTNGIFVNMR
ncbi:hypothetical protein L245_16440, partial [Salmonella enterica subsp. enterica serovar Worthington str. BCH-4719]